MTIIFNIRHQSEDPAFKIGLWAHEIAHDDGPVTGDEEAVVHAIMAMVHMQVLLEAPELAYADTESARVMNSYVLQFLHSREKGSPNSEIVASTGTGVAPGSTQNVPDFHTVVSGYLGGRTGSTPIPGPLAGILDTLGVPDASEFGPVMTEAFEDLNDEWMSDLGRLQISVLLQLVTPAEIARTTGLSEPEVIDRLELQPYLDAIQ